MKLKINEWGEILTVGVLRQVKLMGEREEVSTQKYQSIGRRTD